MATSTILTVRVARKIREAEDICSYELVNPDGRLLPAFAAGSHIDIHLPCGLVRQYSLCNSPSERHRYVIGVLRPPCSRGGAIALHDVVAEGDLISIGEPRNQFSLRPATRSLLFAGGIGVTPLLSMAEHLTTTQRKFELHYYARMAGRMAFVDRIRLSPFADRVLLHVGVGPERRRWQVEAALRGSLEEDTRLYVCGPIGFMDLVASTASALGWSDDLIHRECFSAGAPATAAGAFQVKIASSGQVLSVARHQNIVGVLAAAGIHIPVSCEQGLCGACVTRVLQGEVEHRDQFLADWERVAGDQMTPCVSRARSEVLILDL